MTSTSGSSTTCPPDRLDAELTKRGVVASGQAPDRVPSRNQPSDDRSAQEPAATRHQGLHDSRLAAQTASFSRKILALWRMSTGKEG